MALVFIYISGYLVGYIGLFFGAILKFLLSRQMGISDRLSKLLARASFFLMKIFKRTGKNIGKLTIS